MIDGDNQSIDGDKKVYDGEGRQGEEQRTLLKLVSCLQWPLFL